MKKLFAMVMAVAAISFASCGSKTEKACDGADSCCQDTAQACCGQCPMKALNETLEAGDAEGLQAALGQAAEKIEALLQEGKTEQAQKLGSAIKEFIDTNKAKLAEASVNVDNIVSTIATLPETIAGTAEAGAEAVKTDAEAAANAAIEAGTQKANEAIDAAQAKAEEKANEAVEAGKAKANEAIDNAAAAAKKKLGI